MVVDGVGGQAAGGKAADTAITLLRARLERETGPVPDRLREAIAVANNEIHRLAALRTEWTGMACVLTVVVVDEGRATIGHVGDTRLYRLRHGLIEKVTRDHSPVGEREDAGEISELEAMNHPRRNEVYRDVGSEPHQPDDPDFIEVKEVPFEPDAALLLCSDGLTDLVDSASIQRDRRAVGRTSAAGRRCADRGRQRGRRQGQRDGGLRRGGAVRRRQRRAGPGGSGDHAPARSPGGARRTARRAPRGSRGSARRGAHGANGWSDRSWSCC